MKMLDIWPIKIYKTVGAKRDGFPESPPRVPGGGHRDPAPGQADRLRHRLARGLVRGVPAQLRARLHAQGPGRSTRAGADQDHRESCSYTCCMRIGVWLSFSRLLESQIYWILIIIVPEYSNWRLHNSTIFWDILTCVKIDWFCIKCCPE